MVCRPESLIADIPAQYLIADKGYDSDAIVEQARSQRMQVVIPPRKNRKGQREYDKHLYRQHHLVENAFLALSTRCWCASAIFAPRKNASIRKCAICSRWRPITTNPIRLPSNFLPRCKTCCCMRGDTKNRRRDHLCSRQRQNLRKEKIAL